MQSLILASASPRRIKLLAQLGIEVEVMPASTDETPIAGESVEALVARLSVEKAKATRNAIADVSEQSEGVASDSLILAADTMVELHGQLLGKPVDRRDGVSMLIQLSNQTHQVVSGVCLNGAGRSRVEVVRTEVKMGSISKALAEAYWDTGEPVGKAGGYAIQGLAAGFVACVSGSYSNVVGLPLYETRLLLTEAGIEPFK